MSSHTMIHSMRSLAELATYPGTHDKDRYARTVRQELRTAMEEAAPGPLLVLQGVLRLIDRREPVAANQRRLCVALDVITTLTGTGWRGNVQVLVDGDLVLREAPLFSSPATGRELVASGAITDFDPDSCTCSASPEDICFAAVHNA